MLPSRLFRNVGIPASLYRQSPTVTLRFTTRAVAAMRRQSSLATSTTTTTATTPEPLIQEPRLRMTFTCTAPVSYETPDVICSHRSTHEFTKQAYTKGIVLVQCPECENRHLIADHLSWFKDSTEDGRLKTVEDLMRAKGEKVRRGTIQEGAETIEFAE